MYWYSVLSGHTLSIETGIYWILFLEPLFCALPRGLCFPLVPGSVTDDLSILLGILSLTTRSSSENCGPWTYGDYSPLNLLTIWSLALLKRVNRSSKVNHSLSNYGSSSLYTITLTIKLLDVTSLIQNYGYAAVLIVTLENMSSNTTWYYGEIEPVNKFRTKLTCV